MQLRNTGIKISLYRFIAIYAKDKKFRQGYEDYFKGSTPDYDSGSYERGRVFAVYTKLNKLPRSRWVKGILSTAGQERLKNAITSGYVI